jgi:hypothetical protein
MPASILLGRSFVRSRLAGATRFAHRRSARTYPPGECDDQDACPRRPGAVDADDDAAGMADASPIDEGHGGIYLGRTSRGLQASTSVPIQAGGSPALISMVLRSACR